MTEHGEVARLSPRAILALYSAPTELVEALEQRETPDVPCGGQLWRASWADTSLLVLLLDDARESHTEVAVATVTERPPADSSVPVLTTATAVLPSLTVWTSLKAQVGVRVLDALLEDSPVTACLSHEAAAAGAPSAVDPFDPGAQIHAELADELAVLCAAPRLY